MAFADWLQLIQVCVTGIVALLVMSMKAGVWGGEKLTDLKDLTKRQEELETEVAGITRYLHDWPDKLRLIFVAREGRELERLLLQQEHQAKQITELFTLYNGRNR